jgi:K+/H+ antiporter YhaU regulatory subunit KhtT
MSFIFVIPVVAIIVISAFIVKIAAVALNLTGLDNKRALFQSISAFTGTGFTTSDAELVVHHDIRRRIVMVLMVLGNAGLVSVISTLMLSFFKGGMTVTPILINISIIMTAILAITQLSRNKVLTRNLTKRIQARLMKTSTFTGKHVEEILRLAKGYGIAEVILNEKCVDIGRTLFDSSFRQKDILILAIERGTSVIPAPHASDRLLLNDTLICYGKLENISHIGESGAVSADRVEDA